MPASRILAGVSKSGSPWESAMTSRPAAFNSVARAVIAIVGEGFTRARRSARRAMAAASCLEWRKPNGAAGLCEDAVLRKGHSVAGKRSDCQMFELTFLGTAASTPSAERGLPAVLVQAASQRFLIDCGEGTQRQLLRAGTGFRRLGHILLTHAHLDHVLGLGGLIATLGLFDVRNPLSICGSGETIRFIERYLASLYPLPRAPVPLQLVELQPGPVLSSGEFTLTCFPVRHRGTESLGFRFDTKSRRHVRADRLVALGVPSGPLRARL